MAGPLVIVESVKVRIMLACAGLCADLQAPILQCCTVLVLIKRACMGLR